MTTARRRARGFSLIETLIVIALIGIMAAVGVPFLAKIGRHNRLLAQVHEIQATLLAARMQAIKRNQQVVVQFFINDTTNCPETGNCAVTFVDNGGGVPANANNFVQNAGEPTIGRYIAPARILFMNPAAPANPTVGICFDKYASNGALVDLVAFRGDGTIVNPQDPNSARPAKPGSYTATVPSGSIDCQAGCRGIFVTNDPDTAASTERDYFRISVDDFGSSGKISVLKWLPDNHGGNSGEVDFVPGSPWVWLN